MLSIQKFLVSEPDSDGDMRAEALFNYTNDSQEIHELVLAGTHVLTEDGLVIASANDELEDFAEPGQTVELETSSSYFRNVAEGRSFRLLLNTVGCRCIYKEIGEFDIRQNCISGSPDLIDLGEGFLVQGVSVSAGQPEDDGEINVEIKVLVRNTSNLYTPKIKIQSSINGQNGRELDECSTYGDSMMPTETLLLEANSYLKKSRVNGAKASVRICLFIPSTFDQAIS